MVKPTSGICCETAQKRCEKLKVFVQNVKMKKVFKKALKFLKSCDIIFGVKGKRLDGKQRCNKCNRMEDFYDNR